MAEQGCAIDADRRELWHGLTGRVQMVTIVKLCVLSLKSRHLLVCGDLFCLLANFQVEEKFFADARTGKPKTVP